ncbi:hypothetical protein BT63DRAFT_87524 [Microthyrium microscopicum]|uniref:Uncharacterized protein n=1 Tax=Microthyrium microscopicum TaxID=703497 RepID=A0A6A6U2N7_9PEZI|nr:hypothetical protein BT63DRAFT_87524 [Microthyrium microscopicum]
MGLKEVNQTNSTIDKRHHTGNYSQPDQLGLQPENSAISCLPDTHDCVKSTNSIRKIGVIHITLCSGAIMVFMHTRRYDRRSNDFLSKFLEQFSYVLLPLGMLVCSSSELSIREDPNLARQYRYQPV